MKAMATTSNNITNDSNTHITTLTAIEHLIRSRQRGERRRAETASRMLSKPKQRERDLTAYLIACKPATKADSSAGILLQAFPSVFRCFARDYVYVLESNGNFVRSCSLGGFRGVDVR